jgi:hypothetical protein
MEQARSAVRDLLACRPNFTANARRDLRLCWQPEMVEQMLGDLRRVGLDVPENATTAPASAVVRFRRRANPPAVAIDGLLLAMQNLIQRGARKFHSRMRVVQARNLANSLIVAIPPGSEAKHHLGR